MGGSSLLEGVAAGEVAGVAVERAGRLSRPVVALPAAVRAAGRALDAIRIAVLPRLLCGVVAVLADEAVDRAGRAAGAVVALPLAGGTTGRAFDAGGAAALARLFLRVAAVVADEAVEIAGRVGSRIVALPQPSKQGGLSPMPGSAPGSQQFCVQGSLSTEQVDCPAPSLHSHWPLPQQVAPSMQNGLPCWPGSSSGSQQSARLLILQGKRMAAGHHFRRAKQPHR